MVAKGKQQSVAGVRFQGYGSSHDAYPHTYLTAAAALGGSAAEADEFCLRLGKCIDEVLRKHERALLRGSGAESSGARAAPVKEEAEEGGL